MFVAERIGSVGPGIEIFAKIAIVGVRGIDPTGPTGDSVGGRNRGSETEDRSWTERMPHTSEGGWGKRPPR